MKWYAYPIAITAYCIYVSMLVAGIYIHFQYSAFWLWAAGIGLLFLGIGFGLSKAAWSDEFKVALQIAFILAPLIYLVNQKESTKEQVRIFLVPQSYYGRLVIHFVPKQENGVKRNADTVYQEFDKRGRLSLSDDYRKVTLDMTERLFYKNGKGELVKVKFATADQLPPDTTQLVLVFDESQYEDGRLKRMSYIVDKPQYIRSQLKRKK